MQLCKVDFTSRLPILRALGKLDSGMEKDVPEMMKLQQ